MAKQVNLQFRKGDLLAIAAVLILAIAVAVSYLPKAPSGPVKAEIYHEGELVETLSLEEDICFEILGDYTNEITVKDGRIAITASDCPGEDCVHSGAIGTQGRSLVCLPNGLEIRVVAASDDVDFVVR